MYVIRRPELLAVAIGFIPITGAIASIFLYPNYMDIQSLLVAFLASTSFIFSIYGFSWFWGVRGEKLKLPAAYIQNERPTIFLYSLFLIAFIGTANLVNAFVMDFGFDSLLSRPDLFQSNAIVNSYGYLLYLNVFVFALYSMPQSKSLTHRIVGVVIFICSILSLIFAGNKSYLFQAILFYMLIKSNGAIGSSAKRLVFVLGVIIILFGLYDEYIDFADSSSVFDRPMIYIFGGWATLQSFINDGGYSAVYIGDHLFYPVYKILTFGKFDEESLFKFYDVEGFDLNQFSIFGSAFLDFWYIGVIFVGFALGAVEYFLRFARYSSKSDVWVIIYWYFITELSLSFFFANMFSSLYVYTSVVIVLILDFIYRVFAKRMRKLVLRFT